MKSANETFIAQDMGTMYVISINNRACASLHKKKNRFVFEDTDKAFTPAELRELADFIEQLKSGNPVSEQPSMKKNGETRISDLLTVIHEVIIKSLGENSIILNELKRIDEKIQSGLLNDYSVEDNTFWKFILRKSNGKP